MTKSSNKLDYLSKYVDKKSKKKKKKDRKTLNEEAWLDQKDQEEETDDQPIVVDVKEEKISFSGKGQWETVGTSSDSKGDHPSSVHEARGGRRRFDSSDSDDDQPRNTLRRYDSSKDETESSPNNNKPSTPRRKYDSSSEEDERARKSIDTKRTRRESQVDNVARKRRHDSSSSDNDVPRRKRHDSSSSEEEEDEKSVGERQKMSSGHSAGLQSGSNFSRAEEKLQRRKQKETQEMINKYGHGDTVVRDKTTFKPVAVSQLDPEEESRKERAKQIEVNTGRVQKQQAIQKAKDFLDLQESAFARRDDDEKLEAERKKAIRDGDPMAAYEVRKHEVADSGTDTPSTKPIYKGPPPKSNRFGIRPGFRWDGVDRGNGFEDKLLDQKHGETYRKEQAHRWSTADM